jgi:N-methylhydantoinase A
MTGWQVGIDIGGTFTDVIALNSKTGELATAKTRSRADDPMASLLDALDAVGIAWRDVDDLVHGTTMVTNAIVEGRLARVALIATEGFVDTLAIGRQNRLHLYRLDLAPKLPPQIPDALRFELAERVGAAGEVLAAPTENAIEEVARQVAESGAEAVAVSLLHSYANPEHEERLGIRLRASGSTYVALSHSVNPEAREYERTATTALSAGVMPLAAGYLDRLDGHRPAESRLHLFHSAGGLASPSALRDTPLGLAFSGPAAGVAAAGTAASSLGIANAISFDMGGTTTDVCMIVDGQAEIRSDGALAGRPLRMPMVGVESIGAGGGSIARLDTGALHVGPESAGADPGPACYGRGGTLPTVTDANLVLGYLDDARLVGGSIRLDRAAAERAVAAIADEMGLDLHRAALGIVRVVNASMVRALRRVTVERGIDGRDCALLAFGGAGPMHAVGLAREFGIRRVVVPRFSSVFSAVGCITAEMSYTQQRTVRMSSAAWEPDRLNRVRADLQGRLSEPFQAIGREFDVQEVAAIRYSGQSYAVEIRDPAFDRIETLGAQFRERHETLYGFATDEPWELVAIRTRLSAPQSNLIPGIRDDGDENAESTSTCSCWFEDVGEVATPRLDRESLSEGQRVEGPAVVEDAWSTIVLPPGADLSVDAGGNLHIDVGAAA